MTALRVVLLLVVVSVVPALSDSSVLAYIAPFVKETVSFVQQCGGRDLSLCLKEAVLSELGTTSGDLRLARGLTLKQTENTKAPLNMSSLKLPDDPKARELAIDNLLMDQLAKFLSSHILEFKMLKDGEEDESRSLDGEEERRKKFKKKKLKMLLPLLLVLKLKSLAILPQAIFAIGVMAVKASIIGMVALIISGLVALKKLLETKPTSQTYEVVAHPHQTHSHVSSLADDFHHFHPHLRRRDLRPDPDLQLLPYSAYVLP